MIEVAVKDQEGNEFIFMDHRSWLLSDINLLSISIAQHDLVHSHPELNDPSLWPRKYEILFEGEWVAMLIGMWAQKL